MAENSILCRKISYCTFGPLKNFGMTQTVWSISKTLPHNVPGWATCKSFTLAFNLTFTVLLWPLKRTRFTLKQPLWTLWRPRTALSGQIWSQLLPVSPSELVSQLSCSFSSYKTFSLQPGPSFGPKHTFVGLWRSLKTHKRPQLALTHLFSVSLYVFGSRHGPKSSLAPIPSF